MTRPTRQTVAGRAYLDLQNRARRESRGTQELLTLYVVERWLARLSQSPYADQVVLKGGMLLAAFDARRTTTDADALARDISNDEATVLARVVEIAGQPVPDDGVVFRTDTATARAIRDDAFYPGVRVAMDTHIASAAVKFRLDVNFGDPITPAPQRLDSLALAGAARHSTHSSSRLSPCDRTGREDRHSHRARSGEHPRPRLRRHLHPDRSTRRYPHRDARRTARHRRVPRHDARTLSNAINGLIELRGATYAAYRNSLGPDGAHLPSQFDDLVAAVTAFADPLAEPASPHTTWRATHRRWQN